MLGYGGILGGNWFFGAWPQKLLKAKLNISILELYPIVVAMIMCGKELADKRICINCDNEAVVSIINSQTSKNRLVMVLLRELVLTCLNNNILIRACHIPGHHNTMADKLSRLQVTNFQAICPNAQAEPCRVPVQLLPEMLIPT